MIEKLPLRILREVSVNELAWVHTEIVVVQFVPVIKRRVRETYGYFLWTVETADDRWKFT